MSAEDARLRRLSPRHVRWVVGGVCLIGIAGMIAGSIADNNGTAITFGLISAVAILGLILVAAVADPRDLGGHGSTDELSESIESRIQALVAAGADEDGVRDLARAAITLGRRRN